MNRPEVGQLVQTTPVPNHLLDQEMPSLRDTELRVLLVVTRRTLGFRSAEGIGRKERDWLTHSYLKKATGRAGASVSAAIESLVKQGLITVTDSTGRPISEKGARRLFRGRLYFSVAEVARGGLRTTSPDSSHSEVQKAKYTKESYTKHINKEEAKAVERRTRPTDARFQKGWQKVGAIAKSALSEDRRSR